MPYIPTCGEDFCEQCGDCLYCYGSDPCYDGGSHIDPEVQYCDRVKSAEG